jgi:hypothetical protein
MKWKKWKIWSPPPGGEGGVREEFLGRQARFGGRKAVAGCGMRRGDEGGCFGGS